MEPLHSINKEQRLYVLSFGDGFTCLGFDVAERLRVAVHSWNEKQTGVFENLPKIRLGTKKHWCSYQAVINRASKLAAQRRARCDAELSPQLNGLKGRRVEVMTTHGEKRRFIVGKSTGWLPCHLEIARNNSCGGPAADKSYSDVRVIK